MDASGVVALAVAVLGVWLWRRRGSGGTRQAERRLRRICFGDTDQMERLIHAEVSRAPGISRAEAANRAVDRYRRDNN